MTKRKSSKTTERLNFKSAGAVRNRTRDVSELYMPRRAEPLDGFEAAYADALDRAIKAEQVIDSRDLLPPGRDVRGHP